MTALQANELGRALQTFMPQLDSISMDTTTIKATNSGTADSLITQFTFTVAVNGTDYPATFTCINLNEARVILHAQKSKKPLFDSGVINQGI